MTIATRRWTVILVIWVAFALGLVPNLPFSNTVEAKVIYNWSDGASYQELIIGPGGSKALTIGLPNDAHVDAGALNIAGKPHPVTGTYPSEIRLDVGGQTAWAFREADGASGPLGMLDRFTNGDISKKVQFPAGGGVASATSLRLPDYADITDARVTVSGNGTHSLLVEEHAFFGAQKGGHFGYSVTVPGDINDDGWDDLLIGAKSLDTAMVFFGGEDMDSTADLTLHGTSGSNFGQSVAGVGDFNGDGEDDFAVGENGTVRVYYGGQDVNAQADLVLTGQSAGISMFGISIAGGSDINADGGPDIVVGDWWNDVGGYYTGEVYVFNGGLGIADDVYDTMFEGPDLAWYGYEVATGGDLDGDGWDDLVIGAPAACGAALASVMIHRGGPWFGGPANATISSVISCDMMGTALALSGDMNGDEKDDLLVGRPGIGSGKLEVFYGRANWPATPISDRTLVGENNGDYFGLSVAYLGDHDGDGDDEFGVGSPLYSGKTTSYIGKTYIVEGSVSPTLTGARTFTGNEELAQLGWAIASGNDIDKDGGLEVVITSPGVSSGKGQVSAHDWASGLLGPVIEIAGIRLELTAPDLPILNGSFELDVPNGELQAALDEAMPSHTDPHGNKFIDLPFVLTAEDGGVLEVKDLRIEYTPGTSEVIDMTSALNAYLGKELASGKAGDIVDIPITVIVEGTGGILYLDGLKVSYTPNSPPIAIIDSIVPTTLESGDTLALAGHGEDEGSIVAYRWSSDIEGALGEEASMDVVLTAIGLHYIHFEVRDDKGRWSVPAEEFVLVVPKNEPPRVTIDTPKNGEIVMGVIKVRGQVSDQNEGDVLSVYVKIDEGDWERASGSSVWSHSWDTGLVNEGVHTLSAMGFDGSLYSLIVSINVSVVPEVPDIIIEPPQTDTYSLRPGERVQLTYSVENSGFINGTVHFEPASHRFASVTVEEGDMDSVVAPGTSVLVDIDVIVYHSTVSGTVFTIDLDIMIKETGERRSLSDVTIIVIDPLPDPADQAVQLVLPASKEIAPVGTVTYTIMVINKGTVTDTYDLVLHSRSGWNMDTMNHAIENLGPGENSTITVRMNVPLGAKDGFSDHLLVTIISRNYANSMDHGEILTKVVWPTSGKATVTPIPPTAMPVAYFGIGMLILMIPFAATEWGKYKFFLLLIPLFSRIKKDMVLDNFTRGGINAFIKLNPGTYYNEIKRHLGISNGVLTYHLNKLEEEGYVVSRISGRYKHYFTKGMKIPDTIVRLNDFQRVLLRVIAQKPDISQKALSKELDVPQPTVHRHLVRLIDWGFITSKRWGGHLHYRIDPENAEAFLPINKDDEDERSPFVGSKGGQTTRI